MLTCFFRLGPYLLTISRCTGGSFIFIIFHIYGLSKDNVYMCLYNL